MPRNKKRTPTKERLRLYQEQNGKCFYCGRRLASHLYTPNGIKVPKERRATIDHIMPLAHGGLDIEANRVLACYACNFKKGDKLMDREVAIIRLVRGIFGW